ncbi:hypothetical protein Trydic_g22116 [Trypoxylus dichotomus]
MLLSSSFHLGKYDFLQTLVILTPGVVILLLDGELIRACGFSNTTSAVDFTPIVDCYSHNEKGNGSYNVLCVLVHGEGSAIRPSGEECRFPNTVSLL